MRMQLSSSTEKSECQNHMYQFSRGVRLDHVDAYEWYLRAAEQGSVDAMYCLGALHDEIAHD